MDQSQGRIRTAIEVLGGLSIIVSLIFVAIEIKQANEVARATTELELYAAWNEFHDAVISSEETADLLIRMREAEPDLTPAERRQALSLANRLFNTWAAVHGAYQNGLISEQMYESLSQDVTRSMALESAIPMWRSLLDQYPVFKTYPIMAPLLEDAP